MNTRSAVTLRITLAVLAIAALGFGHPLALSASMPSPSIAVAVTGDDGPGTLRAAIATAAPGSVVTLHPESIGTIIALTRGQIVIDRDLTIESEGGPMTISGTERSRIFRVEPGVSVTLRNLVLVDGLAREGGAVLNLGILELIDSVVTGNVARRGGGLSNHGVLLVDGTTIEDNLAIPDWGPGKRRALLDEFGAFIEGARDGPNLTHGAFKVVPAGDGMLHVLGAFPSGEDSHDFTYLQLHPDGSLAAPPSRDRWFVAALDSGRLLVGDDRSWSGDHTTVVRRAPDGGADERFSLVLDGRFLEISDVIEQPDGRLVIAGNFVGIGGVPRAGIARLHPDGSLDEGFQPAVAVRAARLALQPDGKLIVAGDDLLVRLERDGSIDPSFMVEVELGGIHTAIPLADGRLLIASTFGVVRLNADGSHDQGFTSPFSGQADIDVWSARRSMAVQADGRILVVGVFGSVREVARGGIIRLDRDGVIDPTFDAGTGANDDVWSVVVLEDDAVLIAGAFSRVDGEPRAMLARLHPDGRLDHAFVPAIRPPADIGAYALHQLDEVSIVAASNGRGGWLNCISERRSHRVCEVFDVHGPNGAVHAIAGGPATGFVIGGAFTEVGGVGRQHVARIDRIGGLDPSFDPGAGADGVVHAVAVDPYGFVLLGGAFVHVDGHARPYLARLHGDGSLDRTYPAGTGPDGTVHAMALLDDGRTLIGGDFISVDGVAARRLARLHPDGSLDRTFDAGAGADDTVRAIAEGAGATVLIGGRFLTVGGVSRPRVARLHPDGTVDAGFEPGLGPSGTVLHLEALEDGTVYIAGDFTNVDQMLHSGRGGGIYNRGVLTIRDSGISSNEAYLSAGGVYSTVGFSSEATLIANNTGHWDPDVGGAP